MKIEGRRIKEWKWIHGPFCAVRVEVEEVIPDADPSEPCLEPAAARYLDHVQELANAGDVDELAKHGEVYVRRSA